MKWWTGSDGSFEISSIARSVPLPVSPQAQLFGCDIRETLPGKVQLFVSVEHDKDSPKSGKRQEPFYQIRLILLASCTMLRACCKHTTLNS
jgi:hypothetical protein